MDPPASIRIAQIPAATSNPNMTTRMSESQRRDGFGSAIRSVFVFCEDILRLIVPDRIAGDTPRRPLIG